MKEVELEIYTIFRRNTKLYKSIGYAQELWRPRSARARKVQMGLDQCSTSKKQKTKKQIKDHDC